jgi:putative sigma-54 modulation protein
LGRKRVEISIRPKNFKLQSGVDTQLKKRVERVARHVENVESCEVILAQEPTRFNAQRMQYVVQLTIRTRNNNLIRSEVKDADLLTAMDQAIDRLGRQIERFKGRFYNRKKGKQGVGKSSAQILAMHPEMGDGAGHGPGAAAQSSVDDGVGEEDELGEVVRVKRFSMEPMWPEEAIEQMELLGHSFYVFYNAGEEQLNVLYRRTDGNYGLLQPELG